jgi:hypothetical protein
MSLDAMHDEGWWMASKRESFQFAVVKSLLAFFSVFELRYFLKFCH